MGFFQRWRRLGGGVVAAGLAAAQCVGFAPTVAATDAGYAECTDQGASDPCCADACDCGGSACCNNWGHCSSVWGEFLYLHATGVDMVHAQQQDGIGGAGTVPFGLIGAVDPDYEPGFRLGGILGLSESSSFGVSYSFYESDSTSSVVAPIIAGGGGAVGSLVHHPGAGITASAGPVDADYEIEFQLADFEYRRLMVGDSQAFINYSVGARYAHLDQDFIQRGIFAGGSAGELHTRTDVEFDGAGALFGLEGETKFGRRGLSLYGNLGVSPIAGQFSSFYTMTNETTDVQLANAVWKDDRFVTILDFEIGTAWTSANRLWRLSTGYTAAFWFNAITTPEFVGAVQADNYTGVGDTISFDGITARIERRF